MNYLVKLAELYMFSSPFVQNECYACHITLGNSRFVQACRQMLHCHSFRFHGNNDVSANGVQV